jgi:cytidine deaminase
VGSAIDIGQGRVFSGCNFEYGGGIGCSETRGLHAEETAIADAVVHHGSDIRIEIVAVTADTDRPVTSCGNCLDIIRTYGTSNTIWVAGCSSGEATLFSMDQVFPVEFPAITLQQMPDDIASLVAAAKDAVYNGLFIFSERTLGKTGAAALVDSGEIFKGVREDSAAYHPISAVDSSIVSARIAGNPWVRAIAIVSPDGTVHGRDRQRIFEKADELDRLTSLEVYLVASRDGVIRRATPQELLPRGFGARSMGLIEAVRDSLQSYTPLK